MKKLRDFQGFAAAIDECCTCGGGDSESGCPACQLYHAIADFEFCEVDHSRADLTSFFSTSNKVPKEEVSNAAGKRQTLVWYSHRYGRDPANLARAKQRFEVLRRYFAGKGKILHAPWFALSDAGTDEPRALEFCKAGVVASDELFLDLDGEEQSPGMLIEHEVADAHDIPVSWFRDKEPQG